MPRVSPYPETPDWVFPGTPCYRVAAGGEYVYVFVLDPASVGYPRGWGGTGITGIRAAWQGLLDSPTFHLQGRREGGRAEDGVNLS